MIQCTGQHRRLICVLTFREGQGAAIKEIRGNNMAEKRKNGTRVVLLDEIRGFAIICMVVYHTMFQLKYSFGVDVPIFFDSWFGIIRDIFAGAFIFIAGCMCRFSRNNLKRGVQCFFLGMIITFVVPFFGSNIEFGILHFMGISMMLYGLFEDAFEAIPSFVGMIFCVLLAVTTWNIMDGYFGIPKLFEWALPDAAYNVGALFPFGFAPATYEPEDYFPLLPWIFVFLGGSFFGEWAKNGDLPGVFYNSHLPWLAAVGRYTIWIYMLHIPIVYLVCWLIFP